MLTPEGDIHEGSFVSDGSLNGFCISFIAKEGTIDVGWYNKGLINGNYMSLDAVSMKVIE